MESLSIQLQPFFEWLLRTTVKASVLIGLILLVQVMLRGKLSVRWRYCLWLVLLIRMAMPWAPASSLSVFNLIPVKALGESLQTYTAAGSFGVTDILLFIWLTGAVVLAVYVFASDFNLWRIVKSESLVIEQDILELLEDCKRQMGVRTILGLVITDKVRSPALFGFVRPRLLLPKGMVEALGRQQLRYVFLHELGHLKRHDIYLGWLMSLLQVLHWFNPLIWLAFYRMRANRELACDALVLAHTQSGRAKDYGRTIVSLLERFSRPQPLPSMAGILETKVQLKRRIKMIAKFKKTSRKRSVAAVLVMMALACITLTDPYPAKAEFIFGTPTNLGPTVNTSSTDSVPNISADGLELYFCSTRPGGYGDYDLYVASRATTEDDWGTPVNLGATVNSSSGDGGLSISADGLSLYIDSDRPGGLGNWDLWVTTRVTKDDDWGLPVNLGLTVNSSAFDVCPSISADSLSLYFASMRPGGYGLTDIWVTTRETTEDDWGTPVNLGPIVNSSYADNPPTISPDGLVLFFGSNRPGGLGYLDLWVTTRETTDAEWSAPVNLGPTVNSSAVDFASSISADGSTLYFVSGRPGGSGGWDLWQVAITLVIDFNRDKIVDFKDFSILAQYWRQEESLVDIAPPPLGDGIIDFKDVGVFAENWLLSTMQASNPNPADGATGVDIDADLSWTPGDEAALHEVYFGSDPFAPPLVATQPVGQDSYDPPGDLILGTTYYWRIDEVNNAGPPPGNWPGVLWSFTTISGKAYSPYPGDGASIDGEISFWYTPVPDNIYVEMDFEPGVDANTHEGFFSDNLTLVEARDGSVSLGAPPRSEYPHRFYAGFPITGYGPYMDSLVRGTTYYWCVDETDSKGQLWQGDVWSFTIRLGEASDPDPYDFEELVSVTPVLRWEQGASRGYTMSNEHDIYFGTNWADVNAATILSPEYMGLQAMTTAYGPGDETWEPVADGGLPPLDYETNYY